MAGTNFKVKNGLEIQSGTVIAGGGAGTSGQVLSSTGTGVQWVNASSGSGTVTSVGVSGANGIGVTNSPITTSGTIALSLGAITPTSISTGTGTFSGDVEFAASIKSPVASNSPVIIAPDGTGDLHVNADSLRLGDSNANATIATNGTGDLILTTHEGSATQGIIRIYDGANGNITLTPHGTGQVQVGSDQVVTLTASQTLTNKSLSGSSNTFTNIPNSATTATSANTASAIVARDGSGNFSAGTITASLSGNATTATTATNASILTTTNQGKTGSTGLVTVSSTTAWSDYPIGFSGMFLSGQTATGAPSSNYGFFIKIANRDAGGGWGGIWSDYSGGDTYVGNTTVSSSYATWYKLLSSTNYNSYAPTLTGTGASGTWGISISGNAATATSAATLTTARTINTTSFNGSADITIGSKSNIGTPSAQGTNYYGTIYVSQTATPTGGSTGDLYLVY